LYLTGKDVFSYGASQNESEGKTKFATAGQYTPFVVEKQSFASSATTVSSADVCIYKGLQFCVWLEVVTGSINRRPFLRVTDVTTGTVYVERYPLDTANTQGLRVLAETHTDQVLVYYATGAELRVIPIQVAAGLSEAPSISGFLTLATDLSGPWGVDFDGNQHVILAYNSTTPATIHVYRLHSGISPSAVFPILVGGATNTLEVLCRPSESRVYFAWSDGTGVKTAGFQIDLSLQYFQPAGVLAGITAAGTLTIQDDPEQPGRLRLWAQKPFVSPPPGIQTVGISKTSGAALGTVRTVHGPRLLTRAFHHHGRCFVWLRVLSNAAPPQYTAVLVAQDEFSEGAFVSSPAPAAFALRGRCGFDGLSGVAFDDAGNIYTGLTEVTAVETSTVEGGVIVRLVTDTLRTGRFVEANRLALFASGHMYDGRMAELGFVHAPPAPSLVSAAAGGFMTASGVYTYCCTYEWEDSKGNHHRSAPSPTASITLGGSHNTVTATLTPLRLTSKRRPGREVDIVLWRTEASGTILYRVGRVQGAPDVFSVTLGDGTSDALLSTRRLLYTTGGTLPNDPPQTAENINVWDGRVVLSGTESGAVYFSRSLVPGEEPAFSDVLTRTVGTDSRRITACGVLDDKLIVFTAQRPFVLFGTGPNDTGVNDQIQVQAVAADVGCTEPASVIAYPSGLLFKSQKGLCELNRALQVRFVGGAVKDLDRLGVRGASLVADKSKVRFVLNDTQSTRPSIVVEFDYRYGPLDPLGQTAGMWAVHYPYTDGSLVAQSCVTWRGSFVIASDSAVVQEEADSGFPSCIDKLGPPDAEVQYLYSLKFRTGWLKFAGLQGFQRVRRVSILGSRKFASANMVVRLYHDYTENFLSPSQTVTVNPTTALAPGNRALSRIHVRRQKCQSICVEVEGGNVFEDHSFTGIALEIGVKRGGPKLPAANTF